MKKAFEPNVAARLKTIATLMPSGVAIAEPDGPVQADGTRSYRVPSFACHIGLPKQCQCQLQAVGLKYVMFLIVASILF